MASLEVELHRRGSLQGPKQKSEIDRPWSIGSARSVLRSPPSKVAPPEKEGFAEEERKLLGKRGQKLKHASRINCICYVPEARVIAAGREDGKLLLWKGWKTEGCNKDVTVLSGHAGRVASIICMPPSVRGSGSYLLFSGSSDLSIKIWDPSLRVPEKVCVSTLLGHGGTVTCMALVGRTNLVSGSTDSTIRLWRASGKDGGSAVPMFTLHRTIALMDDWVNAMFFDTTKRVGDLGILYTADSAGGVTAFLPQVAVGHWRPDGTTPLDFAPAGPATSYGLLGSAKSVRLFGMGALSRSPSAASGRDLSTRSSCITDRSLSPEPSNLSQGAVGPQRSLSREASNLSQAARASPEVSSNPSLSERSASPEPPSNPFQGARALERISEAHSVGPPASPERRVRIPTRFSPDVEAMSDARQAAESREQSGSRASTSTRCPSPTGKNGATLPVTSPKPAFLRLDGFGISHVLYDAAHHLVITLARDQKARAYDEQSGTMLFAYENPHQCLFTGVAWDIAHQEIILVDDAGYVHVYSQHLPGITCCQQVSSDSCTGVLFLEDSDTIAAVCGDHVVFCQLERERDFHTLKDGHLAPVVAFSYVRKGEASAGLEDTDWLFSASADGSIKQWDMESMRCESTMRVEKVEPTCLLFCQEERTLFSGHEDGSISIWNLDTRQAVTLREQSNTITSMVSFTRKNGDHCLATASFDGTVALWSIHSTFQPLARFLSKLAPEPAKEILHVAYHQGKELLFTAGNDSTIRAWSLVPVFEDRGVLSGHEAAVTCLLLTGDTLISGSENGAIRVWDVALYFSCAHRRTLEGHRASVTGLTVQHSSGHLLSCSLDSTVMTWDWEQGLLLRTVTFADDLRCVAVRNESGEIVVGTQQGSMTVCRSISNESSNAVRSRRESFIRAGEGQALLDELEARMISEAQT